MPRLPAASRFFQNLTPDTTTRCFQRYLGPNSEEGYPPIMVAEHYLGKLMLDAEAKDAVGASRG
jgi:hypothetical protein